MLIDSKSAMLAKVKTKIVSVLTAAKMSFSKEVSVCDNDHYSVLRILQRHLLRSVLPMILKVSMVVAKRRMEVLITPCGLTV